MSGDPLLGAIQRLLDRQHVRDRPRPAPRAPARDRTHRTDGAAAGRVRRGSSNRSRSSSAERVDRLQRRIAQRFEARQLGEAHQDPQVERRRRAGTRRPRPDRVCCVERLRQLGGRRLFDFEPDDVARGAGGDFALDQLELRPAALVVELELRVAAEPDARGFAESAGPGNSWDRCARMMSSSSTNDDRTRIRARGRGAAGPAAPGRWPSRGVGRRRRVGLEQQRQVQTE